MNSTLVKKDDFSKDVAKLRLLPKDSEEYNKIAGKILTVIEYCLSTSTSEPLAKLLNSQYVCPIHFRVEEETNSKKIADTILSAFVQPGVLKNFRFAVGIAESTTNEMIVICNSKFGKYIKTTVHKPRGDINIEFLAH